MLEGVIAVQSDGQILFVEAAGNTPRRVLREKSIAGHECSQYIRNVMGSFFEDRDMKSFDSGSKAEKRSGADAAAPGMAAEMMIKNVSLKKGGR